ncbi:beta-galactosidase [Muricauda sp. CAU 1633]|uniref:glycoside hydrolase family 2 protein n=1 Tax=Allomuricauda sp. CAU 1633 TaxID=2816036 RepID=UPI001A902EB9|nr:glycoside hydrolase family 2 TIM barrel-domain containing protein [Muricauda sp. CAU 1633]MBO0324086.1 beta-galactosidase [Muricauda sp. CAU 1633]
MKQAKIVLGAFMALAGTIISQAQETEKIMLSGEDFEHPVKWDFMCTDGANSNIWTTINVPSHWEFEGFGEYTYGRWYAELKSEGGPSKEEGFYKYEFDIPLSYKGKDKTIVFGGAMTDTEVKINGKLAGEIHQGGFYEFKYNITSLLKYGEKNLLEVHVYKHSANESINAAERKADWWLFGGIYRPVWLEIAPKTQIEHIAVNAKMDGSLTVDMNIKNLSKNAVVEASITALKDGASFKTHSFDIPRKTAKKTISMQWDDVALWTPETPNLYTLNLTLKQGETTIHEVSKRIGFRTLEFRKKDGIYVNGTKIIMKGIDRHTIWPESGRSTSKRISIMDVNLMKDMNMNAVRGHYPPDTHFLEACDSLGLFVLNELAGWQNPYDTEVGTKLATEMVKRDVNHASVLMWDNGNEGGWNYDVDPIFRDLDPQKRIVIHPWSDFDDWDTHHYPTYQTGVHRFNNGENVFFPTEFLHGTYDNGHGAGLEDFWSQWKESPLFAGGFMWVFSDAAVKRSDWTGEQQYDSKGSLAPDGILGPHREKEGSFYTVKEIWAPIQFAPKKITATFDGSFLITNDYLFSNLNSCTMEYRVVKFPENTFYSNAASEIILSGGIDIPSIEPGETRKIKMSVADNFFDGDLLEIVAHDQHQREIFTWSWPIHDAEYFTTKFLLKKESTAIAQANEIGNTVTLTGGTIKVVLNRENGEITSVFNGQQEIPFKNGPRPIGMKIEIKDVKVSQEGNNAVCLVQYRGGIHSIKWTMHPDGRLKMEMIALKNAGRSNGFDGAFYEGEVDAFGITFDFPEDNVKGIKWLGKGPYRVWKNRIKGATYGVWEKEYNNTITGESFENLIYPEFKGYHANLIGASLESEPYSFKVYSESEEVFLRLFTPEKPKNALPGSHPQPEFPEGDISFMYEIPAQRSFKPLEHHGPKSQPTNIRIKIGDQGIPMNLWFDFRTIKNKND